MSAPAGIDGSMQATEPQWTLANLVKVDKAGGTLRWFDGQEIFLSVNARAAIREACDVLGLSVGAEVLVPDYNCGSEVDALLDCGVSATLYNITHNTNVDIVDIERKITYRTKAIYVIHYFGFPQIDIHKLREICDNRGLFLIEDCALSLYGEFSGRKIGSFGDVAVFCFYKFHPTIGGGALSVNNGALQNKPRFYKRAPANFVFKNIARTIIRSVFGLTVYNKLITVIKSVFKKYLHLARGGSVNEPKFESILPDIPNHYYFDQSFRNASISCLTHRMLRSFSIAESVASRRENFLIYLNLLQNKDGIDCLFKELPLGVCPLSFPILVRNRDELHERLLDAGIVSTPWWKGYHQHLTWDTSSAAHALKENVLALPLHQFMGPNDIKYACECVVQNVAELKASVAVLKHAN